MVERNEQNSHKFSLKHRRLVVISFYFTTLIIEPLLWLAGIGTHGTTLFAHIFGNAIGDYIQIIVLALTIFLIVWHYIYLIGLTRKITLTPYQRLNEEGRTSYAHAHALTSRILALVCILGAIFVSWNLNGSLFPDSALGSIKRIGGLLPIIVGALTWSLPVMITAWTQPDRQ
ncbi:hypothetical protein [Ktedonobacter sp. SOSP1-85]|uniref:hypothetical protein n=1 Tax=Ktedonobacter sp. SOSP1-85 TaxID=2778367 RepID=UPI0019168D55|nr:hypothetical protein [Ktedonobacter sp. SOSP1-85]